MLLEQRRRHALACHLHAAERAVVGVQVAARRAIGLEHGDADVVALHQRQGLASTVKERGAEIFALGGQHLGAALPDIHTLPAGYFGSGSGRRQTT